MAPEWFHLTARMSSSAPEPTRDDTGTWLWSRMRAAFPEAIAAVLMPDHPHLVVPGDAEALQLRLARLLGAFGRRFGGGERCGRVAPAEPIRSGTVLARQVRYVALNPCRAGLTRCPLAWPWSTHRDVVGAIADPWVTAERLARALGFPVHGFAARHHGYVSADPDAEVAGTAFPQPAMPTTMPVVGLGVIARATTAALRQPMHAIRQRGAARSLFVALARDQGWDHGPRLAAVCGCSERTIRRGAGVVDAAALGAARLCLGDVRLR